MHCRLNVAKVKTDFLSHELFLPYFPISADNNIAQYGAKPSGQTPEGFLTCPPHPVLRLPTPRLQDRPRRALVPPPSVPPPSSAPAQTSADADPHPSHGSQVSSCPRSCLSWPLLYTAATAGF